MKNHAKVKFPSKLILISALPVCAINLLLNLQNLKEKIIFLITFTE
jgi:hypothetical protein